MATPFAIERSPALEGVAHGFFGSAGGAHQFGFGGPGEPHAIADLRAAAAQELVGGAKVVSPHQVHSPDVITVDEAWDDAPEDVRVVSYDVTSEDAAIDGMARIQGIDLAYVKPHGALYNDMMSKESVRAPIMQAIASYHRPVRLMLQATPEAETHRKASACFSEV